MDLRVVSYNLRFGGKGRERLLLEVLSSIRFDVAVLQEASHPESVRRLAHGLDIPFWGAKRGESLGFLSRVPLSESRWHAHPQVRRAFLELALQDPPFQLMGIHLHPRLSKWNERTRVKELGILTQVVHRRVDGSSPHLLLGDFNTVSPGEKVSTRGMPAWIRSTIWISGGRIRTDAIRLLLDAGYVDAFRQARPHRPGRTFPTAAPRMRLDYVFSSPGFPGRLEDCRVVREPDAVLRASDHFPLLASYTL